MPRSAVHGAMSRRSGETADRLGASHEGLGPCDFGRGPNTQVPSSRRDLFPRDIYVE